MGFEIGENKEMLEWILIRFVSKREEKEKGWNWEDFQFWDKSKCTEQSCVWKWKGSTDVSCSYKVLM